MRLLSIVLLVLPKHGSGLAPSSFDSTALTTVRYTSSSSHSTRRKRVTSNKNDQHSVAEVSELVTAAMDSVAETIEEMWARETAIAQKELERQLFGILGSLPPFPSVPVPTPKPIAMPSLAPDAVTPTTKSVSPTAADDQCLDGRTPDQFLLDTLVEISSVVSLLNPATPQGQAFNFILNDTLVGEDVCAYTTIEQRYGLGMNNIRQSDTLSRS
jgi:hypothetical protein